MPATVVESIALTIVSRLGNIKKESGHNFTVAEIVRPTRRQRETAPKDRQIQIVQGANTPNPSLSHEGNPPANAYDCVFRLHCFVRDDDNSETPRATLENDFETAVKAVICSTHDWYNFGGKAINAAWGQTRPFVSTEGDHAGLVIPLVVTYRISETDPYTARA